MASEEEEKIQNEIKRLEEIKAFCEEMISLPSGEKRSEKIEEFFEYMKTTKFLDVDFIDTEENRNLKTQYIKASMIYDDLYVYYGAFFVEKENLDSVCRMYRATKNSFLPLALLKSHINGWGRYHVDDTFMNELKDKIVPGLDFANHVRNKIVGHIENDVVDNSIQWEPTIFQDSIKDNEPQQRFLMYRSVLESAINSYVDITTGRHKIFNKEIDIVYPDTSKLFYNYINDLIKNSLDYLCELKTILRSKIIYFSGLPANLMKSAGETDFRVKKKGR